MRRSAIAATLAVAAGLVAVNMLGVASAEAPTTATPLRSVSVEGVATVPIAQNANLAAATAVYRQAMANAMADGQSKAEFLAGKAAGTLGSVRLDRLHERRTIQLRGIRRRTSRLRLAHDDDLTAACGGGSGRTGCRQAEAEAPEEASRRQKGERRDVHAVDLGRALLRAQLRTGSSSAGIE